MTNCSVCKSKIEFGAGTMYVQNDGKIFHFCSSKCKKNLLKLKRDPKKLKWVTSKKVV